MPDLEGEKTGIKTAVADGLAVTGDQDPPGTMDAEQLALLPLRNAPLQAEAENGNNILPRGRGRPPGSKNKSTEAWTNYLLANYRSPLIGLAEIYSRPLEDLARELGFIVDDEEKGVHRKASPDELLDLLKLQMQCLKELAPYVHKKQPIAIDAGETGLIPLNIFVGSPENPQEVGTIPEIKILDVNVEENQELSGDNSQKSDTDKSDTTPESGANQGKPPENSTV